MQQTAPTSHYTPAFGCMRTGQLSRLGSTHQSAQCALQLVHTRLDRRKQGCIRGRRKPGTDRALGPGCGPTPPSKAFTGGQQPC